MPFKTVKAFLLLTFFYLSCGSNDARVSIKFNKLASTATSMSKPAFDFFKMRFLGIYLEQDIDAKMNTVGHAPLVYLQPECEGTHDAALCNIEGLGAKHEVQTYFSFTDSNAVNNAIHGQQQIVAPGLYKYVTVEFCNSAQFSPNINFKIKGGGERFAKAPICAMRSIKMDPPLEVNTGDDVIVTLNYDMNEWLKSGDGTGLDDPNLCDLTPTIMPRPSDDPPQMPGSRGWCIGLNFTPSINK